MPGNLKVYGQNHYYEGQIIFHINLYLETDRLNYPDNSKSHLGHSSQKCKAIKTLPG
jgi:hypothetical protein